MTQAQPASVQCVMLVRLFTQTPLAAAVPPCLPPPTPLQATILLPCCDNFVMHSVRDRLPPEAVNTPLARRMALLIALTWATALTLMTAGASIPIAVKLHPTWPHPGNIVASYVLGFGPLLMALPIQLAIAHVYKKKLIAQFQQQQQQHGVSSGSPAARDQEAL